MTFWLWFLVALAGWVVFDALIVFALMVLGDARRKYLRRQHLGPNGRPMDFNLASDLADQRPARVVRQATAYRHSLDR